LRGVICEAEKEAGKEDVSLSTSHTHGLIPYSEAFLQSIIFLSLDQAGVALSHVVFSTLMESMGCFRSLLKFMPGIFYAFWGHRTLLIRIEKLTI